MVRHMLFAAMGLMLTLTLASPAAQADEADALREQITAMKREFAELIERGRMQAAEKVELAIRDLAERAERLDAERLKKVADGEHIEAAIHQQEAELKALAVRERELTKAGGSEEELARLRKQMAAAEARLRKLHAQREQQASGEEATVATAKKPQQKQGTTSAAAERIKHLRIAAEHLRAAGMHDVADDLMREARRHEDAISRKEIAQKERELQLYELELQRAKEAAEFSDRLVEKGYASEARRQADRLAAEKARATLQQAQQQLQAMIQSVRPQAEQARREMGAQLEEMAAQMKSLQGEVKRLAAELSELRQQISQ